MPTTFGSGESPLLPAGMNITGLDGLLVEGDGPRPLDLPNS
jgi:hypothetical protein